MRSYIEELKDRSDEVEKYLVFMDENGAKTVNQKEKQQLPSLAFN